MKIEIKSLRGIIFIVLIILLIGCNRESIKPSKVLTVIDIAEEYKINSSTLNTYTYNKDRKISYVNITEFITFMDEGLVPLNITKSEDILTISYTFDIPNEYREYFQNKSRYTYEMKLDARNDVISFNDFSMLSNINGQMETQYETELEVIDLDIIEGDPSIEIDLTFYDMNILNNEEGFYIPLFLANLFLTGEYINVYEMENDIYVFDNFSDLRNLFDNFDKDDNFKATDINNMTEKYLALYFDYFYGLKDYNNVDSYLNVLDDYQFEEKTTFSSLQREVEKFLQSQNDLHTSIVSGGYMNEKYQFGGNFNDKQYAFYQAYNENKCMYRNVEVTSNKINDIFVIEINAFTLDTKSLIKPIIEEAKKHDDVMIDMSCNSGGNIIGVIELLSYITDERIPLSYMNQMTDSKVVEYYDTSVNKGLEDKDLVVYTSPVTFSAANLFVSIVKDFELGVIVGNKSSGGAAAINYTVLPDGAIIVNSSNLTFVNGNDEIIEKGVDVDIVSNSTNLYGLYNVIQSVFKNSSEVSLRERTTENSFEFDLTVNMDLESFLINEYYVSVYNNETNQLLYKEKINNSTFSIDRVQGDNLIYFEISVQYDFKGISQEEVIYHNVIDDHLDEFHSSATELKMDESVSAYSHDRDDKDIFKFSVNVEGRYRIKINDDCKYYYHVLYDEDGNEINIGYEFDLEPGTYYILVSSKFLGDYEVIVRQLVDNQDGPTVINIDEGSGQYYLYYDFFYDLEYFELNVKEDSLVTLSWSKNYDFNYRFRKINDDSFGYNNEFSSNFNESFYLPKGKYIIYTDIEKFIGEITLNIQLTTEYKDYSDDITLENGNYGQLQLGNNYIDFMGHFDKDVYFINITESGRYSFRYDYRAKVSYIKPNGYLKNLYNNDFINLEPGRYYFVFDRGYHHFANKKINFEVVYDMDSNNEKNMEEISLNQNIITVIDSSTDIDYYKIEIPKLSTYQIDINKPNHAAIFIILDLDGNEIISTSTDQILINIPEGTYIVKICYHSSFSDSTTYNWVISESNIEDDAINAYGLAIEYYDIIEVDEHYSGKKEYAGDYDVIVINIEESGKYKLNLLDIDEVKYINKDGEIHTWDDDWEVYLEVGYYYVSISDAYLNSSYVFSFTKVE